MHSRSTKGTINYFEAVYCDAFMGICDRWLNNCGRSGRSPPPLRYIYVAIVCGKLYWHTKLDLFILTKIGFIHFN